MATEFNPNYRLHPGVFLKDDLETLGMSQKTLAEKSGISKTIINEVIKGKRNITPAMAMKFEEIIGEPASFWMGIQTKYDLFIEKNYGNKKKKNNKKDNYNYRIFKSTDSWTGGSYAASVFVG